MIALLAATLISSSLACPTVVTGTPSELSFDVAQVAIVREGRRTTFSVSINPYGDPQEFALVMPVPEVLDQREIRTLDTEVFSRLDGYTAPRHVTDAGCPQQSSGGSNNGGGSSNSDPCSTGSTGGGSSSGGTTGGWYSSASSGSLYGEVAVEAEYLVGGYELTILSADESDNLLLWLGDNGYYLPEGAEERLQEYLDAGSYFLAAKVAGETATASGDQLPPLQLSYESDVFSIPLRLATLNSPGEQDMVIYAITHRWEDGTTNRVGISNYPEFDVTDTCVWGKSSDDFGAFYEDQFTLDWEEVGDAGWTVEYAGGWNDCSPCSSTSITEQDLRYLGLHGEAGGHHLTRIRMRYTPEQATKDINLYSSGIYQAESTNFADDNSQNRSCRSECPAYLGDDSSARSQQESSARVDCDDETTLSSDTGGRFGCSTVGGTGALAAGLALLGLARRRRR